MSHDHYDALEVREPAVREAALMAALPAQIAHAQRHARALGALLFGIDAAAIVRKASPAAEPRAMSYRVATASQNTPIELHIA